MRRQWILIGQSFLKKFRTIEDKFIPSRGGEGRSERDLAERVRKITGAFGRLNCNGLIGK